MNLSLCFFIFLVSSAYADHTRHLRHVHITFRHGDRSPIKTFPFDGHLNTSTWPEGFGQLTQIGIEQQYLFGRWLKLRYQQFLPDEYNVTLFKMISTDVDRTLMSGASLLAGLFHKSNSSLSKYGLNWRPIPVHTVHMTSGVLLSYIPCQLLEKLSQDSLDSNETLTFINEHNALFEALRNVTGMSNVTQHNIGTIFSDLTCLESHNLTLPSWYTPAMKDELGVVINYLWELHFTDPNILRLKAGIYLNDTLERMKSVMAGNSSIEFMRAVSAHDTNVAALLGALGLYKNKSKPAYTACVILELVGPVPPAPSSAYHLRVLYKRSWEDPIGEYLQFPACANYSRPASEGCEFDRVVTQLQPVLLPPDMFKAACVLPEGYSHHLLVTLIVVGVVLAATSVIISVFICMFKRKENLVDYAQLTSEIPT